MVCCFFVMAIPLATVQQKLKAEIIKMLDRPESIEFIVGHQGSFDSMVRSVMKELIREGRKVNYSVVLAYMPGQRREFENPKEYEDTVFLTGLESVHPRFAISWRNNWMINESDTVICYIRYRTGGAYQFVEKARRKGKNIINLFDM